MLRVASEVWFYSDERVEDVLARALAIVGKLELTDELRVPAFNRAVDLLTAGHRELEQTGVGVPTMAIPRNAR